MSDPVRNIYKGRFVAKEKLDAAEKRISLLEAAIKQHMRGRQAKNGYDKELYAALQEQGE